jgi:hypothetical protein
MWSYIQRWLGERVVWRWHDQKMATLRGQTTSYVSCLCLFSFGVKFKFAMLPSATHKGNPKFSMPSNVRETLITSIVHKETYVHEWKAKKIALTGRTTLCSLVCFLLFYCCFDEFSLQFWCGDKMGSKVLALVLAFWLGSNTCCQKGKVIVFHMSKMWSNNYWQLSL